MLMLVVILFVAPRNDLIVIFIFLLFFPGKYPIPAQRNTSNKVTFLFFPLQN